VCVLLLLLECCIDCHEGADVSEQACAVASEGADEQAPEVEESKDQPEVDEPQVEPQVEGLSGAEVSEVACAVASEGADEQAPEVEESKDQPEVDEPRDEPEDEQSPFDGSAFEESQDEEKNT
jgi:hypothetical protein